MRLSALSRAISCTILVLLVGGGCARGLVGNEVAPADAGKRILLAVFPSNYKLKIAKGLVDRYKGRLKFTQVSVQDLKSVNHRNYDAVVIIDQLMAWQIFNVESRGFIRSLGAPDAQRKIVLYLTAGSPKPDYRFQGIDAMTGATALNQEVAAIEAISGRIEALLGNP